MRFGGHQIFGAHHMTAFFRRGGAHQRKMPLQQRAHPVVKRVHTRDLNVAQCVQTPRRLVAKFSPYPPARTFIARFLGS